MDIAEQHRREVRQWEAKQSGGHPVGERHHRAGKRAIIGMSAPPSREAKAHGADLVRTFVEQCPLLDKPHAEVCNLARNRLYSLLDEGGTSRTFAREWLPLIDDCELAFGTVPSFGPQPEYALPQEALKDFVSFVREEPHGTRTPLANGADKQQ